MSSIEQLEQQIQNEIQIDEQGRGHTSVRGAARLAGVEHTTLLRHFEGGVNSRSKLAKTLVQLGFDVVSFPESGIPDIALSEIIYYYSHDAGKRCTPEAKLLAPVFRAIGARTWMQKLKGWQEKPRAIASTPAQMFLQVAQQLVEQEQRQAELDRRLSTIEQVQAEARQELVALPAPSSEIPEETTDMKIRRVVNSYCSATGQVQGEVFRHLYQQFHYRYRRIVKQQAGESKLQAFVRLGLIGSLYDLAVELLAKNNRIAS